MGKRSRQKRERSAAQPSLKVLASPPSLTVEQAQQELRGALNAMADEQREQARLDRVNNLPFSAPENRHKLELTFGPIARWLNAVPAEGYDALADSGLAIFQPDPSSDEHYPIVESLHAICDTYGLIAEAHSVADGTLGLRRLARKIDVMMPLFQGDIDAALACLAWMREMTMPMTPADFSDYSVAIQIRATLTEIKRAAPPGRAPRGNAVAKKYTK